MSRISAKEQAIANIMNGNNVCGRFGMITEISVKNGNEVSGKGKFDKVMFVLNESGKKERKTVEVKTNGGRIDNIANSDFVIYAMDVCNSTTKGKRRIVEPKIMKSTTFLAILKECGAIKKVNRGGLLDGYAIQVSNKAFFETMRDYPTKYENGKAYRIDEIK